MLTDTQLEAICRTVCTWMGHDPDTTWHHYAPMVQKRYQEMLVDKVIEEAGVIGG